MKIHYYTHQQAAAIAAHHQYLVGQPFEPGKPEEGLIAEVLVVPYSRILQWRYIYAHLTGDRYGTVEAASPNGRFDVLLLPDKQPDLDRPFHTKCLRTYLQEQNSPFNPAAYKRATTPNV